MTAAVAAAQDVAACRVCGCTEDHACPAGCFWVPDPAQQGDLCSACVPAGQLAELALQLCVVCLLVVRPGEAAQGSVDGRAAHHTCVVAADRASRPMGGI